MNRLPLIKIAVTSLVVASEAGNLAAQPPDRPLTRSSTTCGSPAAAGDTSAKSGLRTLAKCQPEQS